MKNRLKKMLDEMREDLFDDKEDRGKPTKTMPMKPTWKKLHDESKKFADEACNLRDRSKAVNDEKWSLIKRDLNYPDFDSYSVTDDGKTLELYTD